MLIRKIKYRSGKPSRRRHRGFTLIEALFSTVVVGFAVTGLMFLLASGTRVNAIGNRLSSAVFLAEQLHAMTDTVAFPNLMSFNGQTFSGVDASGQAIPGLDNYQQELTVQPVDPVTLENYGGSLIQTIRLTATVTCPDGSQTRISWLRTES